MKYMGSKRAMLKNGLGDLLLDESSKSARFFDPFCGSAAVSCFVAENVNCEVISSDLQNFSINIANAIIGRTSPVTESDLTLLNLWIANSKTKYEFTFLSDFSENFVYCERDLSFNSSGVITKNYGGYYFSKQQALIFDYLIETLPAISPVRDIAVSALIQAASQCAASPGHTAQPFQPYNPKGLKAISEAWKNNPLTLLDKIIKDIGSRHAMRSGRVVQNDAYAVLEELNEGDLVFLDPPYSGVQYSRFYHVLESISTGVIKTSVTGKGRYPELSERPQSKFSNKGQSIQAISGLLDKIAIKKAKAIITFPNYDCSNGLSANLIKDLASKKFSIRKEFIKGTFSTLGGNNLNRPARKNSNEAVILLEPR